MYGFQKKLLNFYYTFKQKKLLQTCVRQCDKSLSDFCSDDQYVLGECFILWNQLTQ